MSEKRSSGVAASELHASPVAHAIAKEAWDRFAHELAAALRALAEDEYLILSAKRRSCCVQFAAQGPFGIRAEASSNFYLSEDDSLGDAQHARLLGLGWSAPTRLRHEFRHSGQDSAGSANYYADQAPPVPFDVLADLAIRTLREVFAISHTRDLLYEAFAAGGLGSIALPNLGVQRRGKV